jgi:myo-inositol-1(or 4)-monophosphatase
VTGPDGAAGTASAALPTAVLAALPESFRYRDELAVATGLGARAREIIRARPITRREYKANRADAVTDVDTGIETLVKKALAEAFPADGFVGEELPDPTVRPRTWYCDPVDGTANFSAGIPFYGFTLSLEVDGEPVLGVLEDPVRARTLVAAAGHGAWLLEQDGTGSTRGTSGAGSTTEPDGPSSLTGVRRHGQLPGAMVLTELLGTAPWPGMGAVLDELGVREATTRVLGSSALTVCAVADGSADAAFLADYSPVDLGASVLAAREAGCTVRMLGPDETGGLLPRACVIGDPTLVEELARVVGPRVRATITPTDYTTRGTA